ncbi:MAG: aldehyde ferredoxin oxidoreductase family protein [Promethearchaeota archaeon]
MNHGITGKVLWIDLSKGTFNEEHPDEDVYRSFLGGYGIGVYYLYRSIEKGADPLGEGNVLGFCPGLLTGTLAPLSGRCMICAKSPLTGTWGDSNVGGRLGVAIKRSGHDAVFIKGISNKPVYILVTNEKVTIKDASDLWGMDAIDCEEMLKERHGIGTQVAAIGRAGENKSLISGIVTSGGRIAGRSGLGAVMGSKNLKAICFSGSIKMGHQDKQATLKLVKSYHESLKRKEKEIGARLATSLAARLANLVRHLKVNLAQTESVATRIFRQWGTSFATSVQIMTGDTPIKNFSGVGYLDFPDKVAKEFNTSNFEKWITGSQGCFSCPIQCGHLLSVPEIGLKNTHRPEYETLASFGALILNENLLSIFEINDYLNRAGMDSISAGVVLAFVIECCEKGYLSKEDFTCKERPEGFIPRWNDPGSIMPILRMMVNDEGIGKVLKHGVKRAAAHVGKDSKEFAMAINGQEIPMHDPRKTKGLIVSYLTDPTPARHTAACLDYAFMGAVNKMVSGLKFKNTLEPRLGGKEHSKFVKFMQFMNALGLCQFSMWFGRYPLLELIKSIQGWNITIDEMLEIGWRIQVLRQMFNAREESIHFDVPKRALGIPPLRRGPLAGITLDPKGFIEHYFKNIGFDEFGVPSRETLEKLNLNFCIKDLSKAKGCKVPDFSDLEKEI